MRISFVSHEFPPLGGGASTALQHVASRLAGRGHAVQVVTIGMGWKTVQEKNEAGVEIVRLGVGRKRIMAPSAFELLASCYGLKYCSVKHIVQFNPDCLCAFFAFPAGFAIKRIAKKLSVPLIISLRGSDVPGFSKKRLGFYGKLLPHFFRSAVSKAERIVPNGYHLASLADSFVEDKSRIVVIPNGVDTAMFSPGGAKSQVDELRVLFVGQFIERKRCLELTQGLGELPEEGNRIRLSLAGHGPQEELLRLEATKLPARVEVRFLGLVNRADMPDLFRDHDLLVQISKSEGVSNVILEGLASGLGVLASKEAVDYSLDGLGGFEFLDIVTPDSIGAAVDAFANNPERMKLIQTQAEAASENIRWAARIDEFEELISDALAS